MAEKFEIERLPRENIRLSIPIEKVMQENIATIPVVKKQSSASPKDTDTVFVFLMGSPEMKAGWRFAEPSWGIKIDGQVKGIFPDTGHGKGKDEAIAYARKVAAEMQRTIFIIE